jgi:hypothetical protein
MTTTINVNPKQDFWHRLCAERRFEHRCCGGTTAIELPRGDIERVIGRDDRHGEMIQRTGATVSSPRMAAARMCLSTCRFLSGLASRGSAKGRLSFSMSSRARRVRKRRESA